MMKTLNPQAHIFVPDQKTIEDALARTKVIGIGAHPDDLEFMCFAPIAESYELNEPTFTGIILTHGGGSSRSGHFQNTSDEEMTHIRREEQIRAAQIGKYSALIQLHHSSQNVKEIQTSSVIQELKSILECTHAHTIYTHNLADKHTTHVATAIATILAIRQLPLKHRPQKLLGGEVWRNLDWLLDQDKITKNVSKNESLMMNLMGVFQSQIAGGKGYDEATRGRKRANAVYHESHNTDQRTLQEFYLDMSPLIQNDQLDIAEFMNSVILRFQQSVFNSIKGIH